VSAVRVLVVGGLTRLDAYYREAPEGVVIEAIYVDCPSLEARAEAAEALVLVASNVSHPAAAKVRNRASSGDAARVCDRPERVARVARVARTRVDRERVRGG